MNLLKKIARRILQDELDNEHRLHVEQVNKYVGWTERYIVALEERVGATEVERLRTIHNRFDTKTMIDAGAWP